MRIMSKISALSIALIVVMVGVAFAAELNLTKLTVTPASFKKGQTVHVDIEVQNPNAAAVANPGDVYFYLKDGTPEREGPGSFVGTTHLPPLPANSKTTVRLAQAYAVPVGAGNQIIFTLHLPPITPGVEFGPAFQYKYNASCTYSPEMKIMPLGMKPLTNIRKTIRK